MYLVCTAFCWTVNAINCLTATWTAEGGGQACFCVSWMSAAEKESYLKWRSTERGSIWGFSVRASGRRSRITTICLSAWRFEQRRKEKKQTGSFHHKQHGCFHTENLSEKKKSAGCVNKTHLFCLDSHEENTSVKRTDVEANDTSNTIGAKTEADLCGFDVN